MPRQSSAPSLLRRVRNLCALHLIALQFGILGAAQAQPAELFDFFEQEAQALGAVTASRSPHDVHDAPATVHVVTRADLDAYGMFHLWDALRGVPGVDVFSARAADGIVSIRGQAKVNNNRTLILLNGRRVLDGYVESLDWESLPVAQDEIDRIEIVEGPVSALYGGNAISGVINIITRSHEVDGAQLAVVGGTGETGRVSALYSGTSGPAQLQVSAEASTSNQYELSDQAANDVVRGRARLRYRAPGGSILALTAGGSNLRTEVGQGGLGNTYEDGSRGFVRADAEFGRHQLRASWSGGSTLLESFGTGSDSRIDYDTVELQAQSSWPLAGTQLVVGAEVRRDDIDATLATAAHTVWGLFAEHRLRIGHRLSLWSSARVDHHPHAGTQVSPRLTAVAQLDPGNTVRLTAGTAFRNPTLLENHLELMVPIDLMGLDPSDRVDTVDVLVKGNTAFAPERMQFAELAHVGRYGRLQSRTAMFIYRLQDVFVADEPVMTLPRDRVLGLQLGFANGGTRRAWGGESQVLAQVAHGLTTTLSYSLQKISGSTDGQTTIKGTPHHKGTIKARYANARWTADAALHRVGPVEWNANSLSNLIPATATVDGYQRLDLSLRYRPPSVPGTELQLLASNLLASDLFYGSHHELLPAVGPLAAGQGGERIGARYGARLVYRF